MGDWTAEREASFRRMLALRFEAEAADQFDALARDMLSALDAERAARQAAERERDEAQAKATEALTRAAVLDRDRDIWRATARNAVRERDAARAALAPARDLYDRSMNAIHEAAGIRRDGLAGILVWIEATREERDEAQAALVGLREYAARVIRDRSTGRAHMHFDSLSMAVAATPDTLASMAVAATPDTLAGQVRARVLREAADDGRARGIGSVDWLRELAAEAER